MTSYDTCNNSLFFVYKRRALAPSDLCQAPCECRLSSFPKCWITKCKLMLLPTPVRIPHCDLCYIIIIAVFEFPSRKEKIWLLAVNYARSWPPPHTGGYRSLEEEQRPGTHINFTISIISEISRKIVQRDFELDWVTCVFTIEWW